MKNATLLLTLSTFFATYGYCQATGAYAGAAAATTGSAQTAGSALGHSLQNATSQTASGVANANANSNKVSGTVSGSSSTATELGKTSATAMQTGNLSAELTQKISSKNAKVGDDVIARTTSTAQLAGGTKLPKGTRLIGKVTEVDAKSGAQHDGHLAFAFDRAVLRDGREIPIHATLQSITAPYNVAGMEGGSDDLGLAAEPVGAAAGARASGGLLGGASGAHTSGLLGGATSAVASAPAQVTGVAGATAHTTGATLHQGAGLVSQTAGVTAAAVTNLPGLSASSSASNSTVLDAKGKNVDLSSGTQLMLGVSAQ